MSHRAEPERPEPDLIDLGSSDEEGGRTLQPPAALAARPGSPIEDEDEEEEEEEDELALTNRQFNELFVYRTSPLTPSFNYPSPPSRFPLPTGPTLDTLLNRNDQRAPQYTTVNNNVEQLRNHQSTETANQVAVAQIVVNGGTVMNNTVVVADTDAQRNTADERGRPHRCSFCPKKYAYKCRLTAHLRKHTGERPFQCDQCPKSCARKGSLKIHLRLHTGERPFQCTVCPKAYTRSQNLKYHREHAHLPPPTQQPNRLQ